MTMSNAVNLMNPSVTAINNNNNNNGSAVKADESAGTSVKQVSVKNHPVCAPASLSSWSTHPFHESIN